MRTYVVVDDSPEYLSMVKQFCDVKKIMAKVVCYQDPLEAMNYISRNARNIEVVFTDYNMRGFGISGEMIAMTCIENNVEVYIVTGYLDLRPQIKCEVVEKTTSLIKMFTIFMDEERQVKAG